MYDFQSVERQVSAIEVEFARKQMGYLKQFLPDNFTKAGGKFSVDVSTMSHVTVVVIANFQGDNDAVILNVLFPRLAAKAKLLAKLIAERVSHCFHICETLFCFLTLFFSFLSL